MITIFIGCEAEKDLNNSTSVGNFKVKKCSMDDVSFKSNPKLMKAVNQLKNLKINKDINNNSVSKIIYDEKSGLYYDDEKGIYVSKDGKESYNFLVINNPNEKIENITFNKNENGDYDIYIVKYDYTEEDTYNFTKEELAQREIKYQVLLKKGIAYPLTTDSFVCVTTVTTTIESFENHPGEGPNGSDIILACNVSITHYSACTYNWGNNGGTTGGGSSDGGNGGGGGSSDDTDQNTQSPEEGSILSAAVTNENPNNGKPPCDILKEQVYNNPTFDNKIDSIKQRVLSSNPNPDLFETSITVKKEADSLIYSMSNDSTISNGNIVMSPNMTDKDVACAHNHPINTLPIFSPKDIIDLYDSYNFVKPSRKEVYTSYLVCFNGATYALRIENLAPLTSLFSGLNLDLYQDRDFAEKKIMNIYKSKGFDKQHDYSQNDAEKLFLDILSDLKFGGNDAVSIYRRDDDGWGKLIKDGTQVTKIPCN